MTPQREGTEVAVVPAPTRENEITCHASYPAGSGKHIVTGTWFRPIVVEQAVDAFDTHNIGIVPPGVAPRISALTSGNLSPGDLIHFARYDSLRGRYSELSPPAAIRVDSGDPGSPNEGEVPPGGSGGEDAVDSTDEGIPLGIDLTYGTYTVRTKLIQRGIRFLDRKLALYLKLQTGDDALVGTLTVSVYVDSQPYSDAPQADLGTPLVTASMQAALITNSDAFEPYEFRLIAPPGRPDPFFAYGRGAGELAASRNFDPAGITGKFRLDISWTAAATQTTNGLLVKGYYDEMQGDTIYNVSQGVRVSEVIPTRAVVSITRTGGTVSVTTSGDCGFVRGETVVISGADQADYNGSHTVLSATDNVFLYEISTTPVTPATGAITAASASAIFPPFADLAESALSTRFSQESGEDWLDTAERLTLLEKVWPEVSFQIAPGGVSNYGYQYLFAPYDVQDRLTGGGGVGVYVPNSTGSSFSQQNVTPVTHNVSCKSPTLGRISSSADFVTLTRNASLLDSTSNAPLPVNVFTSSYTAEYPSSADFVVKTISFYVTNMVVDPSTLVGQWVRVCSPDRPRLAFVTGKVFSATADRITVEAWGWHVGTDFVWPIGVERTQSNAYSLTASSIQGRIVPQEDDRITVGDPDMTRDSFYSVVDGVSTQDAGEILLLFLADGASVPPPTPGGGGPITGGGGGGTGGGGGGTSGQGGYTITELDALLGDEATDTYDSIVPVIYSIIDNEYYIQSPLAISDLPDSITISAISKTAIWAPFQNYVFPAVRVLKTYSNEGATRLVGVGMGGFDCFVDQPRLENLVPFARMTSVGVIDFSPTDVSIYRNGQFIVTAFDADGNELLRGFVCGAGTSSPAAGLEGASLTATQLQICEDFARSIVLTSDGDQSGDWENQRWEIRRQIVASVYNTSNVVNLFYDEDLIVEAEVASQAWIHQNLSIGGAAGVEIVRKTATAGGDYEGSLNSNRTRGTQVVLEYPWSFGDATGLLTIIPRQKEVFFGRSSPFDWESIGLSYNLPVQSQTPIRTMAVSAATIYLIAEKDEIFELSPTGFIADPTDFQTVIIFSIASFFSSLRNGFAFSCVSTSTWTWPTKRIGFISSEGPRSYNGVEVEALLAGTNSSEWNNYDRRSLARSFGCVDPQHSFFPCVRIAGMKLESSGDRDRQLALAFDIPSTMNLSETTRDFDAMIPAVMEDGSIRVMFAGNSRIFLYGTPPTSAGTGVFLFPYVGGTQTGTMTAATYEGDSAIVDDSATFTDQGQGYVFTGSNIRCAKIDDLGAVQWATAIEYVDANTILVEPDDSWTFADGRTYQYVIGAREWTIQLPMQECGANTTFGLLETSAFRIDMVSTGDFDWPLTYVLYGSGDSSNVDMETPVAEVEYLSSELIPMHAPKAHSLGHDYAQTTTLTGLFPPDGTMTIRSIVLRVSYSGG
jgi:hypothetical protein